MSSPNYSPSSLLQEIVNHQQTREALIAAIVAGYRFAEHDKQNSVANGQFQLKVHPAVFSTYKSIEYLGQSLHALNWDCREVYGQARFHSPDGVFSKIVRIIYCRGTYVGFKERPEFKVRRKGERWQELINNNKQQIQLELEGLAPQEVDDNVWTICVISAYNTANGMLGIYLADPVGLSQHGQHATLVCNEYERVFFEKLGIDVASLGEEQVYDVEKDDAAYAQEFEDDELELDEDDEALGNV